MIDDMAILLITLQICPAYLNVGNKLQLSGTFPKTQTV